MDKYIILSFQKDFLVFSMTNNYPSPDNAINSNNLYHNKLIYTNKYFSKNDKDIMLFVNKILLKSKILKVYLEDYKLTETVLKFIKILKIQFLYLKYFKSLSINECNLIINNKFLTYINAYYIPNDYLRKILRLRKKVNINYRESLTDDFIINQDSIDTDSLYYKKAIHFDKNYDYKEKDLVEFLKINKCLKTIHIHFVSKSIVESIIKSLNKDNRNNIVILLYQDESAFIENNFEYLKDLNKRYKKDLNGEIRIVYLKKFIKNNLFKQLTYNNIKMSLVIVFYVLFVALLFTEFYNYASKINIDKLNYKLFLNTLESQESVESLSENEIRDENQIKDKYDFEKSFATIKKINKDTVGWLVVNNTSVNYPVVQSTNNDYYLKRDIYKSKSSAGWIFMDFRNDAVNLNDNTIIYGHNMKSGIMFGSLSETVKGSWYKNKNNQIISFDTPNSTMKWQIFSIYKTEYTTDYLTTKFLNKNEFESFVKMIQKKSIYNFKENLTYGDKILTLSTCTGLSSANKRLVIHAKLIK